ncbi:HAD family hydrolase [Aureimonas ureilytica]|uniref:sucrose-phosphate synthase n=1 Tax=Aureimonas ureilytica TaxID=401562 RepID=A0A175R9J6_9HYPH|nr:HAD-IIB family hydrolase [Aureimonas ureilytica]KTQ96085.1 HAD family hydrolase [Aureimonas ureilytica]
MFLLHVALQGCLRAENVAYGLTADTGGHIRYLLDLVRASSTAGPVRRTVIATRGFVSELGDEYAPAPVREESGIEILRLASARPDYLPKEDLWAETESFAEGLIAWIEAQDERPDLIHAHYADAASVAAIVEDRLGIPFVFTAHSLGRVKAEVMGARAADVPHLDKRIEIEEAAIARASLVIASSRDEAEVQYAGYREYDPGRIRILPPGSDLQRFGAATACPEVEASINRFLNEPDKPVLLALARPVAKKNLCALVRAYGENAELRQRANLVIMAGNRQDLSALDGEMSGEIREILCLIDRYDLYGHVAYPKTHRPDDVAAIYAYARDRRGIFVNPALNEPFGLTLLEASAVGLPLVATDSGGPNDIIEICGNGELVDPQSTQAIAEGALRILRDSALWDRYAAAGAKAVAAYDWSRHAARYHELVQSLLARRQATGAKVDQLLICDIDNTLVGCDIGVQRFTQWRSEQDGLVFGVATGRSFHSAMSILEQRNAPRPQVMITSVGSEIYHLDSNGTTYTADPDWRDTVRRGWNREAVHRALRGLPGLVPQAALEQRAFKLSYFSDGDREITSRVRERLELAGLRCSVIHSHGRYLDILPVRASKGTAVDFVRRRYGLPENAVFVAGDSGNDIEMLRTIPQAIIVANFSDDLASLPSLKHSYVARATHARGVIEGVLHFRNKARAAWPSSVL